MTYTYKFYSVETGLTKIGRSANPQQRFKTLGGKKKLRLINLIEGDIERKEHDKYSDYRVKGEWFALPSDVLKSEIAANTFDELPEREVSSTKSMFKESPIVIPDRFNLINVNMRSSNKELLLLAGLISERDGITFSEAVVLVGNQLAENQLSQKGGA